MFEWNRSNTLALASHKCANCRGIGMKLSNRIDSVQPCKCVLRSIFRACFERFRDICVTDRHASPKKTGAATWGRIREEYLADFCLLAERTLTPAEHQLFRFHFMLGADWRICTKRLNMDKGNFFHAVYRIEEKLGRAFTETQPYGLYPLDQYFGGTVRVTRVTPVEPPPARALPLRPPMAQPVDAVAIFYITPVPEEEAATDTALAA